MTATRLWQTAGSLSYPKRILLLGSGQTPPEPGWPEIPSLRVNVRTLDQYPEYPTHTILVNRRHYDELQQIPANLVCCDTRYDGKESRVVDDRSAIIGVADATSFWPYSELPVDRRPSTGLHIVLWLLFADLSHVYVAGYDGWRRDLRYSDCNGTPYPTRDSRVHDFTAEWGIISRCAELARSRGVHVELSTMKGTEDAA